MLISALVWLLVVVVLAAIVFYALNLVKLGDPWDRLIRVIIIVIVVCAIFYKFLPILSAPIR